mgnify:FL=1|jgi:hypothetical protein
MTAQARTVLSDCRYVLALLEAETDFQKWRIHWIAAVALIRAVGHVLHKVDGKAPKVRDASNNLFKEWKREYEAHKIFHEFIERERNHILKEYEVNLFPLDEVPVVMEVMLRSEETGELRKEGLVASLGNNIYRPLLDGYREGDDARDVYEEAIAWWETQLTKLEETIEKR